MSAVVITLNTPYYGISDRKGTVAIPNVLPGRYEMHVWHEMLPQTLNNRTRPVSISETASSFGVLHLAQERNLSLVHKNKYRADYDTPSMPIYTRS